MSTKLRRAHAARELAVLRAMCAGSTLLNSEISAAPILERELPARPQPARDGCESASPSKPDEPCRESTN